MIGLGPIRGAARQASPSENRIEGMYPIEPSDLMAGRPCGAPE